MGSGEEWANEGKGPLGCFIWLATVTALLVALGRSRRRRG